LVIPVVLIVAIHSSLTTATPSSLPPPSLLLPAARSAEICRILEGQEQEARRVRREVVDSFKTQWDEQKKAHQVG